MKKLIIFILFLFICSPSYAVVYCKRFPTDTAVPCYGPDYPPPGSGGSVTFTDGVHTVANATQLTVTGGTVGGSTPNATLTVTGGSGTNYWTLSPGNVGINTTTWNVGIGTVTLPALLTVGTAGQTQVTSTGNVGINMAPSNFLDVNANGSTSGSTNTLAKFHANQSSGNSAYFQITETATGTASARRTILDSFDEGSNARELDLQAQSGGNVGIGVAGTSYPLDVQNTKLTVNFQSTSNTNPVKLKLQNNTATDGILMGDSSSGGDTFSGGLANATQLGTINGTALQLGTNSITALTVGATSQNVGINTTSAPNKLYVAGTAEMQAFKLNQNPVSGYFLQTNSVGVGTWVPAPTGAGGSPAGGNKAVQYNNSSSFGGDETKFSFDGTNVGIGTSTPNNALDIVGAVGIAATTGSPFATSSPAAGKVQIEGNVGIGTTFMQNSAFTVMSGNVGIGTWVPAGPFDVGPQSNHFLIGPGGNVGIGTVSNAEPITSQVLIYNTGGSGNPLIIKGNTGTTLLTETSGGNLTISGTVTSSLFGSSFGNTANTGANAIAITGSQSNSSNTGGSTGGSFTGALTSNAVAAGGGAIATGSTNKATYSGTGTLDFAKGVEADCQKITSASGVISDCYSVFAKGPTASGGGTITRAWALGATGNAIFTGNVGIGTVLTTAIPNAALFVNGNVGIGTGTPGQKLEITGNGSLLKMYSPDGTAWKCGPVNTTGVFTCT